MDLGVVANNLRCAVGLEYNLKLFYRSGQIELALKL